MKILRGPLTIPGPLVLTEDTQIAGSVTCERVVTQGFRLTTLPASDGAEPGKLVFVDPFVPEEAACLDGPEVEPPSESRPCVWTGRYVDGKPERRTWCGRLASMEFAFLDAAHASLTLRNEGSFLPCQACCAALAALFQTQA